MENETTENSLKEERKDYIDRLNTAFDGDSMADVARLLGIPHATVRNYYQGRFPASEVLVKIANKTGISLNWLLTGAGERYTGEVGSIGLGRFVEDKITQMIGERFAELQRRATEKPSDQSPDPE
jgi:transcriptional regulator with XRE-family HTH domain